MSDIDPDLLRAAIKQALARARYEMEAAAEYAPGPNAYQHLLLAQAAEAHLAILPRWKEVEVVQWATFTADGAIWSSAMTEQEARNEACRNPKVFVVRLTGTAKVKVA